jgi:hypothetical protein
MTSNLRLMGARATVESTYTSQSMVPAASALARAAWSTNVPSRDPLRNRVCSMAHGPCRSGTSRQAPPSGTSTRSR